MQYVRCTMYLPTRTYLRTYIGTTITVRYASRYVGYLLYVHRQVRYVRIILVRTYYVLRSCEYVLIVKCHTTRRTTYNTRMYVQATNFTGGKFFIFSFLFTQVPLVKIFFLIEKLENIELLVHTYVHVLRSTYVPAKYFIRNLQVPTYRKFAKFQVHEGGKIYEFKANGWQNFKLYLLRSIRMYSHTYRTRIIVPTYVRNAATRQKCTDKNVLQ